jgi:hypothetical protein
MPKTKGTITIEMSNEGDFSVSMQNVSDRDIVFALNLALHNALERIAHPTLEAKKAE